MGDWRLYTNFGMLPRLAVYQNCDMVGGANESLWTFYDFVDANGVNDTREWRSGASDKVQAAFDAKVDILNAIPPPWTRPLVGTLEGYDDVYELRFKEDRIQWRVLFCYGPGQLEATFLVPAREVNNRFEPLSAPGTAAERAELVRDKDNKENRYVAAHDRS